MNGPLDGPIIAGEDLVWDSPKTGLLPSKARDEWEDLLEFVVGPDRAEEIEEIEEKLGRKDSDLLARDLQEALARAMSESELFAGASFPGLERPSRPRGPNKPEKVINPYVIARVVSEHGTPVEGVRINLLGDDVESSNITGLSGAVQFGRQDPGYYELWMEVPEGMLAWDDIDVYEFEIIERDNPKADFTFKLITNRERDVNSRTSKLNLTVAELPDSGIAYELGTGRGNVIVINSGYDELLRAKDDAAKNAVRAMQASSAVVELCLRGTPSFLMQELNHLFPKVHEAFRDLRKTRKQKESAKKSRRSR
jgi:hypothetical protein